MDFDTLAVKAKKGGKSLKLLIKETARLRRIYAEKYPQETKIKTDVEGDLISVTWDAVRRYDIERGVKFTTFLLFTFNKHVAREYASVGKKHRMTKEYVSFSGPQRSIKRETKDFDNAIDNRPCVDQIQLNELLKTLGEVLRGVEKILYERVIRGGEKNTYTLACKSGINVRRLYRARENVKGVVNAIVYGDGKTLEDIYLLSVKVRGLADEVLDSSGKEDTCARY